MTEPSKAQIEAAARAMMYAQMECGGTPSMTNEYIAKAALTAAAEVRIKENLTYPDDEITSYELEIQPQSISYDITAAAEVGDDLPKYDNDLIRRIVDASEMSDGDTKELFLEAADSLVGWSSANKKMKNATIERCAQVALNYNGSRGNLGIYAAIMALKDQP